MKNFNFLKRVLWLLIPLLTLFNLSAWGTDVTLTESEIKTNFTSSAHAYGDAAADFDDGDVNWYLGSYSATANSKWVQIRTNSGSYLKITTPTNTKITGVTLTVTSASNSSGGAQDISKHTAYSGRIALLTADATGSSSMTGVGYTTTITSNVASISASGTNRILYLKTSAAARIWEITVTYGSACDKTVTLNTGSATNGTISYASSVTTCSATDADRNVTISVSPSSGYTLLSSTRLTFTKSSGTATASYVSGPTWNGSTSKYEYIYRFAQNDKGAGSFSVTCDALPRYTVSFNTGTNNPTQANIQEASAGAGITLPAGPTPTCSGDGWSFAGWKETSAVTEQTTTAPTLLSAGSTFYPSGNVTLYAVYQKGEYAKVSSITSGAKYLIVANSTVNYVMTDSYSQDGEGVGQMASDQINESSQDKYSAEQISSTWLYTIESGSGGLYYIRDVKNSSSANYVDIAYKNWYGRGVDPVDQYTFTYYDGDKWKIENDYAYFYFNTTSYTFTRNASASSRFYLYKETITYYSNPTCCTPLGSINGSISFTPSATGGTLDWSSEEMTHTDGVYVKRSYTGITGSDPYYDWVHISSGTTSVTFSDLACGGGTTYTWYWKRKGATDYCDDSTPQSNTFTTTTCACSYYSFHYQHGSDWNTDNICFNPVSGGSNDYLTDELSLPYAEWYNVCWQGSGQSYTATKGFSGTTDNIPMKFYHKQDKSFGVNPQAGNIGGGLGKFHVVHNSGNTNKDVTFIPTGYTLNFGTGDWTHDSTLVFTGKTNDWDETEWYTPMTTLTNDAIGRKIFVGLKTSSGYVWCSPYSEKVNLSGLRTKSGSGENWVSGGLTTAYANKTGKFRIYANSGDKNWYVTFVPHYQLTYNANGGTGTMNPLPETPVSCEETSANRTVTVGACTFAAPSHKEFKEWNTQADGNGTTIATGSRELTGDLKLYAIWKNESYSISATMTNVTSVTSFPVAYTYTGSAANVTYTFAAASGYRLPDNVTVTGSTYTWDKTTGELTLTGTITGDVSITISGTQTHNVTWMVNGVNVAAGQLGLTTNPVVYDDGGTLVLPSNPSVPGSCSGSKVFVGWTSDSEITSETTTAPTLLSSGNLGTVTADATYRAVFAERGSGGGGNTYTRLTAESELYDGMPIVIVAHQNSGAYLQQTSTGITKYTSSIPGSSATSITVTESTLVWTLVAGTGDNSGKWHLAKDANNRLVSGSTPSYAAVGSAFTFEEDQDEFLIYSGSCYCLEYYGNTPVWKFYSPSNCNADYSVYGLWLYGILYTNYITQCSPCLTPSEVTASDVTNNSATINWSGVSQTQQVGGSGTGFTVLWGTDATRANNNNTANVAAGTTTYNLTGLSEGTHYYVWVQSKCDDSWCATPADFTTLVSHTATFYDVDGSTVLQSGSVVEGSAITYSGSTPVSCDAGVDASTTFVGWASAPWSGKLAKGSIPSTFYDIAGGESLPNMGNGNMSFYPVFAKATGDPLTNHEWVYTFTTNKYGNSGSAKEITRTLDGTESAVTVNKDWILEAYGPYNEGTYEYDDVYMQSKDDTKGIKIGTNDVPAATMTFTSSSFSGTITAVKISTSGNSGVNATVSATVNSYPYMNGVNSSVAISSSNTEYSFTGNRTISGQEIMFSWVQESSNALYIKKIEVDYTTGGDISYSSYMTTCSTCTTPSGVTASNITEASADITWRGVSSSGTTGFTIQWGTDGTRTNNDNTANTDANTKTKSLTGLEAGTTYYVWVSSRCDGTWSDRASFTTLAVHDITFNKDNGTLSVVSPVGVVDGETLTFPNVTSTSCGTFVGWKVTEVSDYDNVSAPSPLYKYNDTKENITADESYQAVYRTATGAETNVTDNITVALTGITGTYGAWSDKTATSVAMYAGNTAKNSTNQIQMRASDASGIVSTTSGGKLEQVIITWASNTSGRKVQIYGKTTPYSATSDLYSNDDNVKGTLLEELEYTSDGGTSTLDVDGTYNYIGIKSKSGAAYMTNIAIKWFGSEAHYMTAPTCNAMVGITSSFSSFTYVYGSGPSTAQSFIVSGINLSEALIVTAPTNYEVCKTADGTYTSSVSFTPAAGKVSAETVYIRLAAGLNVGTYNYDAANGVSVASNSATPQTAALNGSVTKAAGAIAFTDFNAVDHYEAELEKGMSDIDVTLTVSVTGDGSVSYSKSPAAGVSPTIPATQPTTTLHVLQPGIWTVTATLTAGTNYTGANTNCEVRVKRVDTYVDFIHNKTIKAYGSGSTVVDGKMEDWGSGYTVPYIDDNATETSGSCQQTHFKFMGWVVEDEINIADGTFKTGWTLIEAGTASKTATTKTYYAVWAKLED